MTILTLQVQDLQVQDVSSSDSENEDFTILENCTLNKKKRKVARVTDYMETIVPALTKQDFKAHFRYFTIF